MKKQILTLLLFSLCAKATQIIDISIPKAGTFLLKEAVSAITKQPCIGFDIMRETYAPSLVALQKKLQEHGFLCLHLVFKPIYEDFCKRNNIKVCFIYRDPRDQLISQVHFMFKYSPNHGRFSFNDLLTALIGDNKESPANVLYPFQDAKLNSLSSQKYISHIKRFYEGFLGWKNSPVCYATKFEDLVGPKGGGTVNRQEIEIANIARHIGVNLTLDQVKQIASNVFGSTWSFREGKQGSWKSYFTEEHVIQFKKVFGNLLIELGYEPDNNWHSHL